MSYYYVVVLNRNLDSRVNNADNGLYQRDLESGERVGGRRHTPYWGTRAVWRRTETTQYECDCRINGGTAVLVIKHIKVRFVEMRFMRWV